MQNSLLTPEELAARWGVMTITLDRWRWSGKGPRSVKIGRQIKYRAQDIEAYEEQKSRQSTTYTQEEMFLRDLQQKKLKQRKRFK